MTEQRLALVVDDHPTNRLLASTLLRKQGWTVHEASSGEEALASAATQRFRLILLDISMPGMSGEETCTRLRALDGGAEAHIIAYTAHAFPDELSRLNAAGFDDVLVKPISRQRLEESTAGL